MCACVAHALPTGCVNVHKPPAGCVDMCHVTCCSASASRLDQTGSNRSYPIPQFHKEDKKGGGEGQETERLG
eukprot:363292-Chlamydomonas_euryale.AAC.6